MKNSNGSIGNRTSDLPNFCVVPQPTAPPRAPIRLKCPSLFQRPFVHPYFSARYYLSFVAFIIHTAYVSEKHHSVTPLCIGSEKSCIMT